jgi:ATP-binding cassette subfamily B protein
VVRSIPGHLPVPTRLEEGITLDDVTFAYPRGGGPVLSHLSVHLPAGTAVAVVGENGAGKTTLAKLLTRMYEPGSGSITIDGTPLSELEPIEWRTRTAATFQDFVRYELHARRTVGVGDLPNIDDIPAVREALERAGAAHVVAALDEGLDTQLGRSFDGGRELSGGQWQSLALARGRMRPYPLLLILDEPTASLDAPSEAALFERFLSTTAELRRQAGTITLIVSHRFSTVRQAGLILVLHEGRITEHGTHDQLLRSGGLYAELFGLQASGYQ